MKVGIIGVGIMGLKTLELLKDKFEVLIWDIRPDLKEIASSYSTNASSDIASMGSQVDLCILFLPKPEHVRATVFGNAGLLSTMKPGSIIVDMSTVDPATSIEMGKLAKDKGVGYLDSPVLGRPSGAGNWFLPIGGEKEVYEKSLPVLSCLSKETRLVGTNGRGNLVKLLNQTMFGAINAMAAEMFQSAERLGFDPKDLFDIISSSGAATVSNLFKELGNVILGDTYDKPNFSVELLDKDVSLALDMIESSGFDPILTKTVVKMNKTAIEAGFGKLDTSSMWKVFSK